MTAPASSRNSPRGFIALIQRLRAVCGAPLGRNQVRFAPLASAASGRKVLPSATKPEQVYRFRWVDRDRFIGAAHNATLQVTLRRVPPTQPGDMESLSIVNIKGTAGEHTP